MPHTKHTYNKTKQKFVRKEIENAAIKMVGYIIRLFILCKYIFDGVYRHDLVVLKYTFEKIIVYSYNIIPLEKYNCYFGYLHYIFISYFYFNYLHP